jgi:hypothetical protein
VLPDLFTHSSPTKHTQAQKDQRTYARSRRHARTNRVQLHRRPGSRPPTAQTVPRTDQFVNKSKWEALFSKTTFLPLPPFICQLDIINKRRVELGPSAPSPRRNRPPGTSRGIPRAARPSRRHGPAGTDPLSRFICIFQFQFQEEMCWAVFVEQNLQRPEVDLGPPASLVK